MGELAGGTKRWAGSACTAMHNTCTPMHTCLSAHPFLCTHTCPHPFPHTWVHPCLGSSHTPVHTFVYALARQCIPMNSCAHPQPHSGALVHPMHLCMLTLPCICIPVHTLHTRTLSVPPLGPPATPSILGLLRITMPAGEEAVLLPALGAQSWASVPRWLSALMDCVLVDSPGV